MGREKAQLGRANPAFPIETPVRYALFPGCTALAKRPESVENALAVGPTTSASNHSPGISPRCRIAAAVARAAVFLGRAIADGVADLVSEMLPAVRLAFQASASPSVEPPARRIDHHLDPVEPVAVAVVLRGVAAAGDLGPGVRRQRYAFGGEPSEREAGHRRPSSLIRGCATASSTSASRFVIICVFTSTSSTSFLPSNSLS